MFLSNEEVEVMTFGRWVDIFHEYKFLYNFETKRSLYKDEEDEMKAYQQEHRPIDSILSL